MFYQIHGQPYTPEEIESYNWIEHPTMTHNVRAYVKGNRGTMTSLMIAAYDERQDLVVPIFVSNNIHN